MGPSLLAPAGGWRAVHDGALRAPAAMLYTIGPFGPPSHAVPAHGTGTSMPKKIKIGSRLKKKQFFFQDFFAGTVPVRVAGAGTVDPKNQSYIAIPFICHLRERSVTTQS